MSTTSRLKELMSRSAAFAAKIGLNIKSNILVQDGGDLKSHIRNHIMMAEGVVPDDRRIFQLAMLAGIEYNVDPENVPAGFQFKILSPEEHQEFNSAMYEDSRKHLEAAQEKIKTQEDYQAYRDGTLDNGIPDLSMEEIFSQVREVQKTKGVGFFEGVVYPEKEMKTTMDAGNPESEHRGDQLMERNKSAIGQVNADGVYAQRVKSAANREMDSGIGMGR